MLCRSSFTVFGLAVAFGLGMLFSNQPAVNAQFAANGGKGDCVGMSVERFGNDGMRFRVYRIFQDGTIEVTDDPCEDFTAGRKLFGKWEKLVK